MSDEKELTVTPSLDIPTPLGCAERALGGLSLGSTAITGFETVPSNVVPTVNSHLAVHQHPHSIESRIDRMEDMLIKIMSGPLTPEDMKQYIDYVKEVREGPLWHRAKVEYLR